MTEDVNARLALRQDDMTEQRFKFTKVWFHVDKGDLGKDRTEAFNLDADRSADLNVRHPLISWF